MCVCSVSATNDYTYFELRKGRIEMVITKLENSLLRSHRPLCYLCTVSNSDLLFSFHPQSACVVTGVSKFTVIFQ